MCWKFHDLLLSISERLQQLYGDKAVAFTKAYRIVEHITHRSYEQLITDRFIKLSSEEVQNLDQLINKVVDHAMPLQYALGSVHFMGLSLEVKQPILIPRPETESWCADVITSIAHLVENADEPFTILDIGTGSGCLALALAAHFKTSRVIALDISAEALALAERNAINNDITNCSFLQSDVYSELPIDFRADLIVSNPPYIGSHEFESLEKQVRDWEDHRALVADDNGLSIIKQVVHHAPYFLRSTNNCGMVWCEIGYQQGPAVAKLFEQQFSDVMVLKDLQGHDRVVNGSIKPGAA